MTCRTPRKNSQFNKATPAKQAFWRCFPTSDVFAILSQRAYNAPDAPLRLTETKENDPESTSLKGSSSTAAPTSAAVGSSERPSPTIQYFDRVDIEETFADLIVGLIFDGQTLRIEFGVTRFEEVKPNSPITGRRYPASRLVLPTAAAVDLINRMQQIAAALTQAGVVRAAPRPGAEPPKVG